MSTSATLRRDRETKAANGCLFYAEEVLKNATKRASGHSSQQMNIQERNRGRRLKGQEKLAHTLDCVTLCVSVLSAEAPRQIKQKRNQVMAEETIFSKIIRREIPSDIVYQDELVTAFRDISLRRRPTF
jgi:adenosyl cobinamide kinase/adenosyl cobinamide phosphate guanylyltransferase